MWIRTGQAAGLTALMLGAVVMAAAAQQTARPAIRFIIPPLETATARAAAPQGQRTPAPTQLPSQAGGRWWNDATIAADLGLATDVRDKMDRAMDAMNLAQQQRQTRQGEARTRFEAALAARQWDEAIKATADLERAMTEIWGAQYTFKVDVLQLLSAEQQATLIAKHGYLMQRPWAGGPGVTSLHFQGTPQSQLPAGAPGR